MGKHDPVAKPGNPENDGQNPGVTPPGPAEPGKHSDERKGKDGKGGK